MKMLRKYLTLCVALCVATGAIGQLLGDVLEDPDENHGSLINIVVPTDEEMKPFVRVNNKFYYFGKTMVTWYKANLLCRSMGGFLADFDSRQESEDISNYLLSNYQSSYDHWWLSAADLDRENEFFWYSTGKRMYNADWAPGQPDNHRANEHCVHMVHTGQKYQLNDWVCNEKAFFICKADMTNYLNAKKLPRESY